MLRNYAVLPSSLLQPGSGFCQPSQSLPQRVDLDDAAENVMTDLKRVSAVLIRPADGVDEAHRRMVQRGVRLLVGLEAIGEADDKGMRTVMTTLNGQLRPVFVRDRSIAVEARQAEKADTTKPGQIAAPFSGVVTLKASVGDAVQAGEAVASIEAMKMENLIYSPCAGTIKEVRVKKGDKVEEDDVMVVIE